MAYGGYRRRYARRSNQTKRSYKRRSYRSSGTKYLNTNYYDGTIKLNGVSRNVVPVMAPPENYNAMTVSIRGSINYTKSGPSAGVHSGIFNLLLVYSKHNDIKLDGFTEHGFVKCEYLKEYRVLRRHRYTCSSNPNEIINIFRTLGGLRCNKTTGVMGLVIICTDADNASAVNLEYRIKYCT